MLAVLMHTIMHVWPEIISASQKNYSIWEKITIKNRLLMKQAHMKIGSSMQAEILEKYILDILE